MYDNYNTSGAVSSNIPSVNVSVPFTGGEVKRRAQSQDESEQTEKTLVHLRGRVEELRERLSMVLLPSAPQLTGSNEAKQASVSSPLTEQTRSFRRVAQDSISMVEDILNRLDI